MCESPIELTDNAFSLYVERVLIFRIETAHPGLKTRLELLFESFVNLLQPISVNFCVAPA